MGAGLEGCCVVCITKEKTKWTMSIQGRSTFVFSNEELYNNLVCVDFAKK